MATVRELYAWIDAFAPFASQEAWDNSGLLVEAPGQAAGRILLALDITRETVEEAHRLGADLIVSHHPVIYKPLARLSGEHPAYWLARYDISAICAHTNLDVARGGVNDILARRLQLQDIAPLEEPDPVTLCSLGRIGTLPVGGPEEIVMTFIRKNLGAGSIRYVPGPKHLQRVAVCGGAGGHLLPRAAALGADLLLTGDIKHDQMLEARRLGIALAGAGHYCTERVVLEPLAERLRDAFPGTEVLLSACEQEPERYL